MDPKVNYQVTYGPDGQAPGTHPGVKICRRQRSLINHMYRCTYTSGLQVLGQRASLPSLLGFMHHVSYVPIFMCHISLLSYAFHVKSLTFLMRYTFIQYRMSHMIPMFIYHIDSHDINKYQQVSIFTHTHVLL